MGNGSGGVTGDAVVTIADEAPRWQMLDEILRRRGDVLDLDAQELGFFQQTGSGLRHDAADDAQVLAGRGQEIGRDRLQPIGRQATLHMGQCLADAGKVPEGRRQGTEPAPATVMAGAILVQQFFHPSRFQQQTTTERSRQRQFAVADGGQAVGEFKQGPAAPADQVVKLLVVDRSLCRLVGGELVSGRVVHDVFFSLPFRPWAVNRKSTFSGFPAT